MAAKKATNTTSQPAPNRSASSQKESGQKQAGRKEADRQRRQAARLQKMSAGVQLLQQFLADCLRGGLADLESEPPSFWEHLSARLVDAQCRTLAGRVLRLQELPRSGSDWPSRMLAELGRLKLAAEAFGRLDQLDPPLAADVRRFFDSSFDRSDAAQDGDVVRDHWLSLGSWSEVVSGGMVQRVWLLGIQTRRIAMIWEFAPILRGRPTDFKQHFTPGLIHPLTLAFYLSACPQRAKPVAVNEGDPYPWVGQPPDGMESLEQLLATFAEMLARQPWIQRCAVILKGVAVLYLPQRTVWEQSPGVRSVDLKWVVQDQQGGSVPLVGIDHWQLLAISGSHPVTIAGEWDGERLRPLGVFAEQRFLKLNSPAGR